jgi:hypothetical protein
MLVCKGGPARAAIIATGGLGAAMKNDNERGPLADVTRDMDLCLESARIGAEIF